MGTRLVDRLSDGKLEPLPKLQSKLKDENWRFSPKSRFSLSEIDSIADSKDLLCLESENSSNARFLDFNKMILDFPSEISKITDYLGPN